MIFITLDAVLQLKNNDFNILRNILLNATHHHIQAFIWHVQHMQKNLKELFDSKCKLKHFIRFIKSEPVVSKKPTFPTESTISSVQKHQGQAITLLCQAQAFPIPLIR